MYTKINDSDIKLIFYWNIFEKLVIMILKKVLCEYFTIYFEKAVPTITPDCKNMNDNVCHKLALDDAKLCSNDCIANKICPRFCKKCCKSRFHYYLPWCYLNSVSNISAVFSYIYLNKLSLCGAFSRAKIHQKVYRIKIYVAEKVKPTYSIFNYIFWFGLNCMSAGMCIYKQLQNIVGLSSLRNTVLIF